MEHKSWLNPVEFMETAIEAGYKDINHVRFIRSYLENRAIIGCGKEGRLPTFRSNDLSVGAHGFKVKDEILSWIKMVSAWALSGNELPFTVFTVSPLTTRVKTNGRILLILDLSYPHV